MGEQPPSKSLPVNQLAFEEAALAEICARSGELGDIIGRQFRSAKVEERWGSGAGFYTYYDVDESEVRMPREALHQVAIAKFEMMGIGPVEYETSDGFVLMMCQLHVSRDGLITCLECVNFGGGWPTAWYTWRERASPYA